MPSSDRAPVSREGYYRRRTLVILVVIAVAVLSFFAGKYYGGRTYIQPVNPPASGQPAADHAGIPPDSLPH